MSDLGSIFKDNLIAGGFPVVTIDVTVLAGESVSRGAVMGKVTASGKYRHCNSGLSDGAEIAKIDMAEDVDATLADTVGVAYLTGEFNKNKMSVAVLPTPGDTLDLHWEELRNVCIFLKGAVQITGVIN